MSGSMLRLFKCHQLTGKKDFEPWWALTEDLADAQLEDHADLAAYTFKR